MTKPRAKDEQRYAYLEEFWEFCQDLPASMRDVLTCYPDKIPVLDIAERMGDTGKIDFLTHEDLHAPVVRGKDRFGRPFFAVCARLTTTTTASIQTNTPTFVRTQAFFRRYSEDFETWYPSVRELPITRSDLLQTPNAWKEIMVSLLKTGQARETYTRFDSEITSSIRLPEQSFFHEATLYLRQRL